MKRSEQPAQHTPPPKPFPMQAAGLYGEVAQLPVSRAVHAPFHEPKTFL
jgi:hypothetical protein